MSAVSCAGCSACCKQQAVLLMPEDEPNLAVYRFDEAITGSGATVRILKHEPNGDCVHLGPEGCTIYEQRPVVCQSYDCRMQFLIMTRNERRAYSSQTVWAEARKRLETLDAEDYRAATDYRTRAESSFNRATGKQR